MCCHILQKMHAIVLAVVEMLCLQTLSRYQIFTKRSSFTGLFSINRKCIPVSKAEMSTSGRPTPPFTTLTISRPANGISHVELCLPEKDNELITAFWRYI